LVTFDSPVPRSLPRCAALLAVLIGCYSPSPREGAPCENPEQCPTPQRCVLGSCTLSYAPIVDAPEPEPDAAVDAMPPPIDAMPPPCSITGLSCPGGTATMFPCGGHCWVRCTGNVTRTAARTACTNWGGALGEINDPAEQTCVAAKLASATWLGLIQPDNSMSPGMGWTWNGVDRIDYTNWLTGKPDDADGVENGAEQCASMEVGGGWDDQNCGGALDFFCERP
jgi:hypothetical protein